MFSQLNQAEVRDVGISVGFSLRVKVCSSCIEIEGSTLVPL